MPASIINIPNQIDFVVRRQARWKDRAFSYHSDVKPRSPLSDKSGKQTYRFGG